MPTPDAAIYSYDILLASSLTEISPLALVAILTFFWTMEASEHARRLARANTTYLRDDLQPEEKVQSLTRQLTVMRDMRTLAYTWLSLLSLLVLGGLPLLSLLFLSIHAPELFQVSVFRVSLATGLGLVVAASRFTRMPLLWAVARDVGHLRGLSLMYGDSEGVFSRFWHFKEHACAKAARALAQLRITELEHLHGLTGRLKDAEKRSGIS